MIFNQMVASCDESVVTEGDAIRVAASWQDPVTYDEQIDSLDTTLGDLLEGDNALLLKGDAIVAYAETLKALNDMSGEEALALIDKTLGIIQDAIDALGDDPDLLEIQSLLTQYRKQF
jgi:Ca-activated chloride channel family protein